MPKLSRYVNCGTVMAVAGFGVFAFLAFILFQFLCYGPGGAGTSSLRYPG